MSEIIKHAKTRITDFGFIIIAANEFYSSKVFKKNLLPALNSER